MKHTVLVENPSPESQAALVLLSQQYSELEIAEWFAFKKEFLQKHLEADGELKCHYCGKTGLRIDSEPPGKALGTLATIDHVIPLSKGGSQMDESNLVIACWPCNQKKGNRLDFPSQKV